MEYKWIYGKAGFDEAFKVRKAVFIAEQKVPEFLERDEFDDHAQHVLVYDNDIPIATGRLFNDGNHFKLGRICVLKPYRGMELGRSLMERLLEKAQGAGVERLYLDSQVSAIGFYRKFGFKEYGNIFDDAGIDHVPMVKICRPSYFSKL